jgi:hypothetical protein
MGASRTSFAKLQRDRAKKAKAEAKRERRNDRAAGDEEVTEEPVSTEGSWLGDQELSAEELLRLVEQLHADFEAERISFEEFEERKTELFARISV